MNEIRRTGPPRELAMTPEELFRYEVPLSAPPSDQWVRRFEEAACGEADAAGLPLGRVVGNRIVFDCAAEDVFAWVKLIDGRIARTNQRQHELPGPGVAEVACAA